MSCYQWVFIDLFISFHAYFPAPHALEFLFTWKPGITGFTLGPECLCFPEAVPNFILNTLKWPGNGLVLWVLTFFFRRDKVSAWSKTLIFLYQRGKVLYSTLPTEPWIIKFSGVADGKGIIPFLVWVLIVALSNPFLVDLSLGSGTFFPCLYLWVLNWIFKKEDPSKTDRVLFLWISLLFSILSCELKPPYSPLTCFFYSESLQNSTWGFPSYTHTTP